MLIQLCIKIKWKKVLQFEWMEEDRERKPRKEATKDQLHFLWKEHIESLDVI